MFTISFNDDGSPIGYLTIEQFAEKIRANVGTVRVYSTQNKIPEIIRICGRVYIPEHADSIYCRDKKRCGGRRRKVKCIDTGKVYESVSAAAKDTGAHISAIVNCARFNRATAGGKRWRYVKENESVLNGQRLSSNAG